MFTPWRRDYVVEGKHQAGCVLCALAQADGRDLLLSTDHWFLVLNAFPYCNGHLMLVARKHLAWLSELDGAALAEMPGLLARAEQALRKAYRPEGMNLGINFGRAGGAGIPDHLHIHLLPRWVGDTNFMTSVGGTRVMPEDLVQTFDRLKPLLER
jgi:ATP adenylyltransferase